MNKVATGKKEGDQSRVYRKQITEETPRPKVNWGGALSGYVFIRGNDISRLGSIRVNEGQAG
jgi:hypothetical protein